MAPKRMTYQIKVTLDGIRPPIWRRILVRSNVSLPELHYTIQIAMGWENCHLHQFIVGREFYGELDPEYLCEMHDESRALLQDIAAEEGDKFKYEYDFGDSWLHTVLVEKIVEPERGVKLPVVIKGSRACPPEDVGGPWGYELFLEAMKDPEHPEHEMYTGWIGGEFDPEAFDLPGVNKTLRKSR